MKELYLYSPIYSFIAESVVAQIEENMGNKVTLRVTSPGGSVFHAYGIYAKMKEHGDVSIKVDGSADSAASFLPFYAKNVECLDVSRFTFHRADMFVENPEEQKFLDGVNKDLKNQMLKKIDADVWLEITGISIDDMFNPATRKDVTITGAEAKKIGLVNKVVKLTPEMEKEIAAFSFKAVDMLDDNKEKNITMTIEELQQKHPAVFAAVKKIGVDAERDRVGACLAFIDADQKGVLAAIKDGKELTQTQMAEFSVSMMKKNSVKGVEAESAETVITDDKDKKTVTDAAKAAELKAFEESLDANIKRTVA
jgi:ATP-dependent protease ClpP protease subunit